MCWILRDTINDYIKIHGTPDLQDDRLTNIEWSIVRVIKDFLKKLSMSTKAYESRELTLDLTLPCIDYILALFERYKNEYKDDLTFATMFNSS